MSDLLAMSLAGSAVVVLMLLLRPVTVKIFPAKWQYRIGKMAIAFFLIPVSLFVGKLPLVQPAVESYPSEPFIIHTVSPANGFTDTMDAVDAIIKKHLSVEVMQVILFIWLVGVIVFAAWHIYCYRRFTRQLRADNIPVPEDAATLLSSCKAALGIHGEVKLMQNRKIASPMLVGLCHTMILLPSSYMQEIDMKLILAHELTHLKRKDLWVKVLTLAAGTLHWFNPFAYVLRKDVVTWGELSCDEALAIEMSREERKLYGEAILNTLDIHSGINTAFCSSLCESKKHIERRLTMLLNVKKTKKHIAVFAVVAILAIGSIGMGASALASQNMPKAENKQVATENMDKSSINRTGEQSILPYSALSAYEKEVVTKEIAKYYVDEEGRVIPYNGKAKEVPFDALSAEEQKRVTVEDGYYPDNLLTPQEVRNRMLSKGYNPDNLLTDGRGDWVYDESGAGQIGKYKDFAEKEVREEISLVSDPHHATNIIFPAGQGPVYKEYDLVAEGQVVYFDTQAELDAHIKLIKEHRTNGLNPYEGFEELYAHIDLNKPFGYTVRK
ncbi:MAG: M56 family metallopeptidase [Ruminiclostridium sp.]